MHGKSFVFGMGAGILILAGLCFFVYGLQRNATAQSNAKALADITRQYDTVSKDLAKTNDANAELSTQLAALKAEQPAPAAINERDLSNDEIISKAKALGMEFAPAAKEEDEIEPEQYSAVGDDAVLITVDIPRGSSSQIIAGILQTKGVVTDSYAFERFLYMEGVTRNIPYGTFTFTSEMTFPEVLRVLKAR